MSVTRAFPYSRGTNVLPQIPQSQGKSKQEASIGSNCVQIAFAKLNSRQTKIEHILRLKVLCIYGLLCDADSGSDTASNGGVPGAKYTERDVKRSGRGLIYSYIYRHLSRGTGENDTKNVSGWIVSYLGFEAETAVR